MKSSQALTSSICYLKSKNLKSAIFFSFAAANFHEIEIFLEKLKTFIAFL